MKKNELIQNTIVLSGQCDTLMRFRTESMFMSFQDVASLHATFLGIDDYSLLEKDNALWVISKTKIKINSKRINIFIFLEKRTTNKHPVITATTI